MRPQPLIVVADVEASSRWYQRLLRARSAHGGREYERLVDGDGRLILQLHDQSVEHHHGALGGLPGEPRGRGVLLWFEVDDFDQAVARATDLGAIVVLPPHRNPPEGDGAPTTASCGCATSTATPSSSPAPTAKRGGGADHA